jgi:hypothetical protein
MKMCFFHFMPYQQLPGNFEKDYHSVRVDAPGSLFGLKHGTRLYSDYPDELEPDELEDEGWLCAITIEHASDRIAVPSFSFGRSQSEGFGSRDAG